MDQDINGKLYMPQSLGIIMSLIIIIQSCDCPDIFGDKALGGLLSRVLLLSVGTSFCASSCPPSAMLSFGVKEGSQIGSSRRKEDGYFCGWGASMVTSGLRHDSSIGRG